MRMRFFPALLVVLLLLCLASLAGAEQLIIPENTRIIEDDAFSGSAQISDVIMPADLKHIGDRAFWGCDITRIEVPDSVTEIGENAFPAGTVIASASDAYAREWA